MFFTALRLLLAVLPDGDAVHPATCDNLFFGIALAGGGEAIAFGIALGGGGQATTLLVGGGALVVFWILGFIFSIAGALEVSFSFIGAALGVIIDNGGEGWEGFPGVFFMGSRKPALRTPHLGTHFFIEREGHYPFLNWKHCTSIEQDK